MPHLHIMSSNNLSSDSLSLEWSALPSHLPAGLWGDVGDSEYVDIGERPGSSGTVDVELSSRGNLEAHIPLEVRQGRIVFDASRAVVPLPGPYAPSCQLTVATLEESSSSLQRTTLEHVATALEERALELRSETERQLTETATHLLEVRLSLLA